MIETLTLRRRPNPKIELMRRVPLLSGCSTLELEAIARLVDEAEVPAGRVLMRQGAFAHEFLVLVEGEAEVRCPAGMIRTVRAGDFVGELALLSGGTRTATVVTTTRARLLVFSDRGFAQLVELVPSLSLKLLREVARRIPLDVPAAA